MDFFQTIFKTNIFLSSILELLNVAVNFGARQFTKFIAKYEPGTKVILEGCMSWPLGYYSNNSGVSSRNLLERLYFYCSKKGMDQLKQKKVWINQDVIDGPHCNSWN